MAEIEMKAKARPRAGKGAARQVRREGLVPGVIYGDKQDALTIALDVAELNRAIGRGKFLSSIVALDVDGTKLRAIPRDVQLDPVKDFPIHVDFQRVSATSRIRVAVPCRFINDAASPGLKRGGVLNIVRHEVEVMCSPDAIPAVFEFDLTGLEIGRSIHISATNMPEGVRPVINNRDFTVATIAGAVPQDAEPAAATADAAAAAPAAAAAAPAAGKAAPAAAAKPAAGGKAPAAAAKPAAKK